MGGSVEFGRRLHLLSAEDGDGVLDQRDVIATLPVDLACGGRTSRAPAIAAHGYRRAGTRARQPSAAYPFSSSTGPVSAARAGSRGSVEVEPVRESFARRPGGPPHPSRRCQILRSTAVCPREPCHNRDALVPHGTRRPSQVISSITL